MIGLVGIVGDNAPSTLRLARRGRFGSAITQAAIWLHKHAVLETVGMEGGKDADKLFTESCARFNELGNRGFSWSSSRFLQRYPNDSNTPYVQQPKSPH